MTPPRATYRLQFNPDFTFADAAGLAAYLSELGISHVYSSPWLKARAGSTHGYDIVDHNAFNPELGGEAGFERFNAALRRHRLKHVLDFVPNHMGVELADNAWWRDVLEWGPASPHAEYFDIRWHATEPHSQGKVLLPLLGQPLEEIVEAGELVPSFDADTGSFELRYHDHRLPLAPHTYAELIRAVVPHDSKSRKLESLARRFEALRLLARSSQTERQRSRKQADALKQELARAKSLHPALAAVAATLASRRRGTAAALSDFLSRQHWRLAHWRVAGDEINYRRFFDINGLAAVRVEKAAVFERMHRLVARLHARGKLDGLRIDHIDGLFDPAQYCRRLRRLTGRSFYIVVEKILAAHERLPSRWPIQGTTGYEFLNQVTALLTDASAEAPMTRAYRAFIGSESDFDEDLYRAKQQVIRDLFGGELRALARELHGLAEQSPAAHGTRTEFTRALEAVAAGLAVYRTYVDPRGTSAQDRIEIRGAIAQARRRCKKTDVQLFDFISSALASDIARKAKPPSRRRALRFAMRFQQYTAPVMAKGLEDTALYRYHRLLALNDVGGDPRRFGISTREFHRANSERRRSWPHALLTTATHDTKRGEDARARLAALSLIPREWEKASRRWARLNEAQKSGTGGETAPCSNDEYLLYQTLIGAWPPELTQEKWDRRVAADFVERIRAYMTKAMREAKQRTSWSTPDEEYERAVGDFAARILSRRQGAAFLEAFLPLQAKIAELGVRYSLAQLALKLTCPGVPDIYRGCELWDFSLVDPDNRRPVDFERRMRLLKKVKSVEGLTQADLAGRLREWLEQWQDGTIKFYVLYKLLQLRAAHPMLFAEGDYVPIQVEDPGVLAFRRVHRKAQLVVVIPVRAGGTSSRKPVLHLPRGSMEVLTRTYSGAGTLPEALTALPAIHVLAESQRPRR